MIHPLPRFVLYYFAVFCLGFGLLLPAYPALAATTDYSTGTNDHVVGNPTNPGDSTGIGGVDGFPGADNANASGNTVNVTGGTVNDSIFGGRHSVSTGIDATANNNTVNIGATFGGGSSLRVYGGWAEVQGMGYYTGKTATVSGNTVNVNGGVFSEIFGGSAVSNDGPANATGNTVNFTGGTAGSIYGGSTWITTFATTYSAAATGNRVFINGGTISNTVYGGYAMVGISGSGNGSSINNTVTITGAPDLTGTTLYGGYIYDGISSTGNGDAFSGNTLNLHSSGLTMAGMANFEKLNFYLPVTMTSDQTMLTVTGTADLTDGASRSSTVNVGIEGSSSPLQTGDQVILIDAGTLTTNSALNTTANGSGMQGVTLKYEFDIMASGNQLLATVNSSGPKVNEQAKALPEGFLSGLALTNLGADLIAGPGLSNAVNAAGNAARASVSTNSGLATFGALSGGWSRYQTGSHVDMSSISLMAGLAFGTDLAPGHLTLAGFFEYGNGSYDTYNSFSNAASVHGDGDIYHIGGGVLGRMDFLDTGPGHFYVEASGRAGGVHNEYTNGDLRDSQNRRAEYDTSSTYYGLHLGVGYLWNINEKASLDLYGKYFWTRQEGDSVTLSTGDPVKFDDVDSHRLRGGARFAYAVNEHVSPYVGAAWEHEFDGRARATTNGFDIDAPSLRGDTGMGELGLTLKPSQTLPLSFDLGVQGYTGKREGVTGSLQLRYNF